MKTSLRPSRLVSCSARSGLPPGAVVDELVVDPVGVRVRVLLARAPRSRGRRAAPRACAVPGRPACGGGRGPGREPRRGGREAERGGSSGARAQFVDTLHGVPEGPDQRPSWRGSARDRACGRTAMPRAAPRRRSARAARPGPLTTLDAARGAGRIDHEPQLDALVARQVRRQRPAVVHALLDATTCTPAPRAARMQSSLETPPGPVPSPPPAPRRFAAADRPVHLGARAGLRAVDVAAGHDAFLHGGAACRGRGRRRCRRSSPRRHLLRARL